MGTRESMNPQPSGSDRITRTPVEYSYEHEDSREIHRDIERTRSLMDETIDELAARLQPSELVRGVWTYFRSSASSGSGRTRERVGRAASSVGHSVSSGVRSGVRSGARAGGQAASSLGHSVSSGVRSGVRTGGDAVAEGLQEGTEVVVDCIRRNPVPSALVGAGLGYFLYNEFLRDDRRDQDQIERLSMQAYNPEAEGIAQDYDCDPTVAEMAELEISRAEPGIVLPAGSDIDSPKYPLEGEAERSRGSDGPSMASKAAREAGAGASAVSGAARGAASSARHAASSAGQRAGSAASQAGSSASQAASQAGSSVSHAASQASHAAASAGRATYGAVRGTGRSVGSAASATYQGAAHQASSLGDVTAESLRASGRAINSGACYTRDASKEATEQYPLLVGLGCAALGMMAGFLLPRTRREDEAFGETAQDIRDRGYEMGAEAVERGRAVASSTATAAMERAEQEGLTPSAMADHASNVASKVKESAKEAMHEEGLTSEELAQKAEAVKDEAKETAKKEAVK